MSFAGYLFGNVDEHGRLEGFDEELRETLERVDAQDPVLGELFSVKSLGLGDEDEPPSTPFDTTTVSTTAHSADAVDYSDFNETVPDFATNDMLNDKYYQLGMNAVKSVPSTHAPVDEDYDNIDTPVPVKMEEATTIDDLAAAMIRGGVTNLGAMLQLPTSTTPSAVMQAAAAEALGFLTSKGPKPSLPEVKLEPVQPKPIDIRELYPAFEKDKILRFSELFAPQIVVENRLRPKSRRGSRKLDQMFAVEPDDRQVFVKRLRLDPKTHSEYMYSQGWAPFQPIDYDDDEEEDARVPEETKLAVESAAKVPTESEAYHRVVVDPWEEKILWDADTEEETYEEKKRKSSLLTKASESTPISFRNYDLEGGDWLDLVVWDDRRAYVPPAKLLLNLNDPYMPFYTPYSDADKPANMGQAEPKVSRKGRKSATAAPKPAPKPTISEAETHARLQIDRYNISNDRFYEAQRDGRFHRVRQTFGQLVVQHSLPALKLQSPFFKTRLTKADLRSFHRPPISFPLHQELGFTRVKALKKKKLKKREGEEYIRTSRDITLKDTSTYILLEFSEEYPPIISNVGMGSLLINYYRKKDISDNHVPHEKIGEPFVLDVADVSPFLNFGNVEPGQTIPTLYNNLYRAPLFRHTPHDTDFLVIKNTYKNQVRFYIREIPHLFVVGQTYPVQEVPGPHSRKITNTVKSRLQVIAYRLIRRNKHHRLRMTKLMKYFPEYTEIQIRQRLKEFAEFQRKGNNTGFWKLKPTNPLPSEEELRKLVTPEMVCLYESMLVGQRLLQDAGYGKSDVDEDEGEEGESKLDIEQQLAPWIITRNFINATQGKAMLKLYGEGDPTGRGEGFSFIRVSMKDIFLRQGESAAEKLAQLEQRPKSAHRYNVAEQQQVYREEIARIWNAQYQSLSNPTEPELTDEERGESEAGRGEEDELAEFYGVYSRILKREPTYYEEDYPAYTLQHFRRSTSPLTSPASFGRERATSEDDNFSMGGSMYSRFTGAGNRKTLEIKRKKRLNTGEIVWETEHVENPAVINAYLKSRREIDEQIMSAELLEPTDDEERNRRMKKRIQDELAKLRRNQERRRQRMAAKQAALAENPVLGLLGKKKEQLVRRCGNCGQLGHMKTNKKCPKFNAMQNQKA
ncbi:uncharacterized protein VTP21DRAFT_7603 [Calcarisporiella thermophila]|uniref:uncharacterized protein n=1 Tax=Calcarisporiella thermophila TaxID=911321 RepID=UPI0037433710